MADRNETIIVTLKIDNSGSAQVIDNAEQQVEKLKKSSKETSEGFGIMNTKFGGMWKSFKEGVNIGVGSLKTFSGALAATGIGVLLIAVSALVNYFKNTKEGGDQLARVMKVLGTVIREGPIVVLHALKIPLDAVVGYFKTLFSVISNTIGVITGKVGLSEALKNVSEEFKKNVEKVKEDTQALVENGKQALERAKQADKIAQIIDAANDQERETLLKKKKLETEIAQARADAAEQDVTAAQKKALFTKALKLEGELYEINKKQAQDRLEIANAEIANGDKSEEMLQQQIDAQVKLEAVKTEYTQSSIRLQKQITAATKAEADAQKKIEEDKQKAEEERQKEQKKQEEELEKEKKEKEKEAADEAKRLDEERQRALEESNKKAEEEWQRHYSELQDQLEADYLNKIVSDEDYANKKMDLDVMLAEHQNATQAKINLILAKASSDQKKQQEDNQKSALGSISSSLKQFSELSGKQSKIGKAMAIAAATIDMYTGAVGAFKSMASIPIVGPALGAVASAAVIAMGLANIAKIRKTEPEVKQTGGYLLNGQSHANGGTLVNMQPGEFVVNDKSMQNPMIAQEVVRLNNVGNAGWQQSYQGNAPITETRIAEIAATVVKAVPVNVTENQITEKQRDVQVREDRFSIA